MLTHSITLFHQEPWLKNPQCHNISSIRNNWIWIKSIYRLNVYRWKPLNKCSELQLSLPYSLCCLIYLITNQNIAQIEFYSKSGLNLWNKILPFLSLFFLFKVTVHPFSLFYLSTLQGLQFTHYQLTSYQLTVITT